MQLVPCVLCLGFAALLFVRKPWVPGVVRGFLFVAAASWALTLTSLVPARIAAGEPWQRLVAILGCVAFFALGSAALLAGERVRAHYGSR